MNRFLVCLIAFVISLSEAVAQQSGVVFRKGEQYVFVDLATKNELVLNYGFAAQSPFAISRDGKMLVWQDANNQFCLWHPPVASPVFNFQGDSRATAISLSARGFKCAFEQAQPSALVSTSVLARGIRPQAPVANRLEGFSVKDGNPPEGQARYSELSQWFSPMRHLSGRLHAFSENEHSLAVIGKGPKGWTNLVVYTNPWRQNPKSIKEQVVGLEARAISCQLDFEPTGLAFKPDGSLTLQSQDAVFQISKEEIEAALKKSGLLRSETTVFGTQNLVKIGNGLTLSPVASATGSKLVWVSDTEFLFRHANGSLRKWNGSESTVLETVPEEFFFCKLDPLFIQQIALMAEGKAKGNTDRYTFGTDRLPSSYLMGYWTDGPHAKIGSFTVTFEANPTATDARIPVALIRMEDKDVNFCVVADRDIDSILYPGTFRYKSYWQSRIADQSPPEMWSHAWIQLPKGQTLLLERNGEYAAIKASDITWLQYDPSLKAQMSIYTHWLEYKWRHWPKEPLALSVK